MRHDDNSCGGKMKLLQKFRRVSNDLNAESGDRQDGAVAFPLEDAFVFLEVVRENAEKWIVVKTRGTLRKRIGRERHQVKVVLVAPDGEVAELRVEGERLKIHSAAHFDYG